MRATTVKFLAFTTVMSPTPRPRAAAIRRRFSAGGAVMSTLPATTGPTQSFSM